MIKGNSKALVIIPLLLGILNLGFPFLHDYIKWGQINLGYLDSLFILSGLGLFILSFLIYLEVRYIRKIGKVVHVSIIILLFVSSIAYIFIKKNQFENTDYQWHIVSIQTHIDSPNDFSTRSTFTHSDLDSSMFNFIADPIVVYENETFYMFFEAYNKKRKLGEIALATSKDGLQWTYDGIVYKEKCHVSFPYVFKDKGKWYMIPETGEANAVFLLKTNNFPYDWQYHGQILSGDSFRDNVVIPYKNKYWLFTSTSNSNLFLYFADSLTGPYSPHLQNPIYQNNVDQARMAGPILVQNDSLFRMAQDDYPEYGNRLRCFYIQQMDTLEYQEIETDRIPLFKGRMKESLNGVHTFNQIRMDTTLWYFIDAR